MKEKYVLALDTFLNDTKPTLIAKDGGLTRAVTKAYKVPFEELDDAAIQLNLFK